MAATDIKQRAHILVDSMPDDATWDDLMYKIYVCKAIEAGIEDADAGRMVDVKEVRRKFGLPG